MASGSLISAAMCEPKNPSTSSSFGLFVGAQDALIPPKQERIRQVVFYPGISDRIREYDLLIVLALLALADDSSLRHLLRGTIHSDRHSTCRAVITILNSSGSGT